MSTTHQYHLSLKEIGGMTLTGFSGITYAARHWDLSSECEETYRLGHRLIAMIEGMPILGGMAALLEYVAVSVFKDVNILSKDEHCFNRLKNTIKQKNAPLRLLSNKKERSVTLMKLLGKGGSKKAFEIAQGRALILPNMDTDSMISVIKNWTRIVDEEVKMSQLLKSVGLLSPLSEKVTISVASRTLLATIPAYTSLSFEHLAYQYNQFIIDYKTPASSMWIENKNFLFANQNERWNIQNWTSVLDEMLNDIIKLCQYNIPIDEDSYNLAIVKGQSPPYQVRYFGFDFSSKRERLEVSYSEVAAQDIDLNQVKKLIQRTLSIIFSYEFGSDWVYRDGKEKIISFKEQIVNTCIQQIQLKLRM
jgi:hypothetical protein